MTTVPKVTFDTVEDGEAWQPVRLGPTWNGWATPTFDLQEFRKVAKHLELTETSEVVNGRPVFVGDSGTWLDTDEECRPREEADADGLYTPDGYTFDVAQYEDYWNDGSLKSPKEKWVLACRSLQSTAAYLERWGMEDEEDKGYAVPMADHIALAQRALDLCSKLYVRRGGVKQ